MTTSLGFALRFGAVVFGAAAMVGCEDPGGVAKDVVVPEWTQPRLGSDPGRRTSVALDDEAMYVAEGDTVRALSARTGMPLWRVVVHGAGASTSERLLVDEQRLYITAWHAVALDKRTGTLLWEVDMPTNAALSDNAVSGSTVYVGSRNHRVLALDAATGSQRWVADLSGGSTFEGITKGISVAGDTAFVAITSYLNASGGRRRGMVAALDARTGAQLWRYETPDSSSGADAAPALAPTTIIVSDLTGAGTFALDRATGVLAWRTPALPGRFGPSASAVVIGDLAYVGSNDAGVYALRAASGDEVWRRTTGASIVGIERCGGTLLLAYIDGGSDIRALGDGRVLRSPTIERVGYTASNHAVRGRRAVIVGPQLIVAFTCPE